MGESRLPKLVRDGDMEGNTMQGGQRKTHLKCAMQSLQRKQVVIGEWKERALQKDNWREMTRAIMDGSEARITGTTGAAKNLLVMWEKHPALLIGRYE